MMWDEHVLGNLKFDELCFVFINAEYRNMTRAE